MKTEKAAEALFILVTLLFVFVSTIFAASNFKNIDTRQLNSMIVDNAYELEGGRGKQFTVVDARTKREFDEAHTFSSISIPEKDFEKSMNLLPHDKQTLLVVYGNDSKRKTSQEWAEKAAVGYSNIVIYREGFLI
jgi:rhodanese-related sulfurtransferase